MDVTNLSSTPVGPPPTTTCRLRVVTKSEYMMVKLYQPCVTVDQPLHPVVQERQPSLHLERMLGNFVKIELKLPTIHKLSLQLSIR